jgi:hypothetical protein
MTDIEQELQEIEARAAKCGPALGYNQTWIWETTGEDIPALVQALRRAVQTVGEIKRIFGLSHGDKCLEDIAQILSCSAEAMQDESGADQK